MAEAADALRNDYSYEIIGVDPEKRGNRKMIGNMAAELLDQMANELIVVGTLEWSKYETERDKRKGSDISVEVSQETGKETLKE